MLEQARVLVLPQWLCGLGADTLAERESRSRAGSVEVRQSQAVLNARSTRVAVVASSTALGAQPVVQGAGGAE